MLTKSLSTIASLFLMTSSLAFAEGTQESEKRIAQGIASQFNQTINTPDTLTNKKYTLPTLDNIASKSRTQKADVNDDVWIYDSWVTLDYDLDYDGYYSQFTVEFDVDTVFEHMPVYAILYIGTNDVFEAIYVTDVFDVYSTSSLDSLVVETELVSGFIPDDYEVMIEIYGAASDALLAFSDGYDDADLAYVPLESATYEETYEETIVIVEEHGGSLSLASLLLCSLLLFRKLVAK